MARIAYHGWLGALTIPLYLAAFVTTIFSGSDNRDFSLRLGIAIAVVGLLLTVAGVYSNRGPTPISRRQNRFSSPHYLAFIPVQYLGMAGCCLGLVGVIAHYI